MENNELISNMSGVEKFKYEYLKFTGENFAYGLRTVIKLITSHSLKYIMYGRLAEACRSMAIRKILLFRQKMIGNRYGIEIPAFGNIEAGLMFCHGFDITINENAHLGHDVTLFKGSTIGSIRSGKKSGAPIIGNNVVIGLNAFVGGNIKIGSNVMIAPGAFVNFDVPNDSVVIGNPGVIHRKENAADDYYTAYASKQNCGFDEKILKKLQNR